MSFLACLLNYIWTNVFRWVGFWTCCPNRPAFTLNYYLDMMLLACSMRSRCSLLPSTGGDTQTLHVEAHSFLRCCRSLQDFNQHVTKFLVGLTQDVSESSNSYVNSNRSEEEFLNICGVFQKQNVSWLTERLGPINDLFVTVWHP